MPVFFYYRRKDKFICYLFIIGSLDAFRAACSLFSFSVYQRAVCLFYTLPPVVTVHHIITAHDCRRLSYANFAHFRFQFFHIFFSGSRRRISSIQETVYVYFGNPLSLCQFQQPVEMLVMAVDAAVRYQSHQMQGRIIGFHILAGRQQDFVFKKVPVLDRLGDLGQILINNAPGAHIQMAHLRISHLSFGKSYCHSAGISFHKRIFFHQLIHYRSLCLCHCISLFAVIQSITVKDHKNCWSFTHFTFPPSYKILYYTKISVRIIFPHTSAGSSRRQVPSRTGWPR